MPPFGCEVDQVGTRMLVRLSGDLTLSSAPQVRAALSKCLVGVPDALIVDLAGLRVREPVALSVFRTVAWQAAVWPGTPLLLCAPRPETADLLAGDAYGRLAVYPSAAAALAARAARRMPTAGDTMLPTAGASRRARELTEQACVRWNLPTLSVPAAMIAGELVTNAIVHARTMADLRVSLGRRHLLILVGDGSTGVPRLDPGPPELPSTGRGLRLVEAIARRWGVLPAPGGKVVWAGLPIDR
ncbi:STAS domain-containing protein [Catenuloplanes atrovinosus]|uniref:Anti-anti-sigma regulatory factor n=1 Tax=Catenuloplanes atrovinosus TaxID=137266 RepID=A0AAE3YMJ4_9ACTN|nr:STAS domain-containing protein [Catenuloplanes atrovinosus]MDR7276514.1 anti-anti-sigma regulatory factor [Catenuloplanes atrovinosus]